MNNERNYFVHESAYVDEPCDIGAGVKIWHFCHIMPRAKIGCNCNLGQNVLVASDVIIGNNVKIQNNVAVYTGVELEDDVFCGPSCVFTNVMNPRSQIVRHSQYQRPWCGAAPPSAPMPRLFAAPPLAAMPLLAPAPWCGATCQTMR